MRPSYETFADFHMETRAANAFVHWLVKYSDYDPKTEQKPLKKHYCADRAIVLGDHILAFLEIKVRTNPMKQYPDYMISLEKMRNLRLMARDTGVASILGVVWTDAVGALMVTEQMDFTKFPLCLGGRTDRGDGADVEPVLKIPLSSFVLLPEFYINTLNRKD